MCRSSARWAAPAVLTLAEQPAAPTVTPRSHVLAASGFVTDLFISSPATFTLRLADFYAPELACHAG